MTTPAAEANAALRAAARCTTTTDPPRRPTALPAVTHRCNRRSGSL
ncbi:hypothetical protein [Mobilicoccus massiliensis]|nr:hypothetical protein [Mobilicoccus massiliensis]